MCVYGLLSFVITSFEEESLQVSTSAVHVYVLAVLFYKVSVSCFLTMLQTDGVATQSSHLIDAACEVLSAPSLAEVFWELVGTKNTEEKLYEV